MKQVASAYKVAYHKEKLVSYLKGEHIYPATLEMDITSQCTRICEDCPSCRGPYHNSLSMGFIDNLFSSLEGQTKGLLLTGGEPTISPLLPQVLDLARKKGFVDISVVTNGSLLMEPHIIDALMKYASTIRISLYDWDGKACNGIKPTLERIEFLRKHIDGAGSKLRIGVSLLTSNERVPMLIQVTEAVRSAGAHWAYYHPMCKGWDNANLVQVNQNGVLETVSEYRKKLDDGFRVFISPSRYIDSELKFDGYHAAHFLLIVGADGINYLGAEVKYQNRFAIADVAGDWRSDFLWQPERVAKINAVTSLNYSALKSRHRGVLYCDYIEKLKTGELSLAESSYPDKPGDFLFPHLL